MEWFAIGAIAIAFAAHVIYTKKPAASESATPDADKILSLYAQIEDMLDSFEDYVREMHAELDAKREELLEISRSARAVYLQALEISQQAPQIAPPPEPEPVQPAPPTVVKKKPAEKPSRVSVRDREKLDAMNSKQQKVRYLMSRGLAIEEVARELKIGTGEILLITELDKG